MQARDALQALSDAIGPFSQLVCHVNASGDLLPMAVATDHQRFSVAFWKGKSMGMKSSACLPVSTC